MKIGDFVRLIVPADRKSECFARGRVGAIETYSDYQSTRTWIYVQWFDSDGRPDKEATKHAAQELEST